MTIYLRRALAKLGSFFLNSRVEEELEREIASHLALLQDEFEQKGMSPEKARLAARRAYGGVEQTKQLHRNERSILWFEQTLQNLRFSLRMMCRDPGLTLTILLTLALGIGANTAIFTVVYATLLAPLPYSHPEQLVAVFSKGQGSISAEDFIEWKQQSTVFQDLKAWTAGSAHSFNIDTHDQPEYIPGMTVTPGYYQMLGSRFYLGRDFLAEEGQLGKDRVVILTHALWERLGANPKIVGTIMHMNDEPYTVVGVLAAGAADHGFGQVIVPLAFRPEQLNYTFVWLLATGRLKQGISVQQAQANMDAVTTRIGKIHPERKNRGALVMPLKGDFVTSDRKLTLWLLLGTVGFILLIACMNVANLLLARGMSRQKEMAIRGSLGATTRAIFVQLLTESLLMAMVSGVLGLGIGYAILRGLISFMPGGTLGTDVDLHLNLPVLLFTLAATTIAGLLFGCAPAWYASQVDPAETLKESGRSGTGVRRQHLRRVLVVGEFSLALALLAGAGLAVHSFWNLTHVDLGIRTDHILTFHLQVPESRPKEPAQIVAHYREILTRIESVPGITHASVVSGMPLRDDDFVVQFSISGRPNYADATQSLVTNLQQVTPDYFQTFGVHLLKGRIFTEKDSVSSLRVALVNEDFVRLFLKGTDPLEQRLTMPQILPGVWSFGPPLEWQIVGVFQSVRSPGLGHGFRTDNPEISVPFWQSPWPSAHIGVRTAEDPASMTKSIAAAVHSVDPQIALANPVTMDQVRDGVLANDRFTMILFTCFAVVALLLASVGIYGVMAFSTVQRSHEIALRIALGSSRNRIVALVVGEGLVLASIGLGLGLMGAYLIGRAMQSILFGVGATDLPAFGAIGLILLLAALLACYLPACRAASVDPMQALRME